MATERDEQPLATVSTHRRLRSFQLQITEHRNDFQCRRVPPLNGAELVLTSAGPAGQLPAKTARTSTSFTIFEGTSEIQRMIIGRAVTGLDVR